MNMSSEPTKSIVKKGLDNLLSNENQNIVDTLLEQKNTQGRHQSPQVKGMQGPLHS